MKKALFTCFLFFAFNLTCWCQTIYVHSISSGRQSGGDSGYTLDGQMMSTSSRLKLQNMDNFYPGTGIYPKYLTIVDNYATTGSLTQITYAPPEHIFFFGAFNMLHPSTQQFTEAEIDTLYDWSMRGGKVIITSGVKNAYSNTQVLEEKWNYVYETWSPNNIVPTSQGNNTDIFNGPFGNVSLANQGGSARGCFNTLPPDSKVLGVNQQGNPTLIMDCKTLDLIVADVDAFTILSGVTPAWGIYNEQDRFLPNTIVFMDKLQHPPIIADNSGTLSLDPIYNNYQWYQDDVPVNGAVNPSFLPRYEGNYHVKVTVNGGCEVTSNKIFMEAAPLIELLIPNVFTPNNDGDNDLFIPVSTGKCIIKKIAVFNRWGELIHEEGDPQFLWNGKSKNEAANEGTYFWKITYLTAKGIQEEMAGFVQLSR